MPLTIVDFTPQSGPVGTRVTINMTGIQPPNETTCEVTVLFDGEPADEVERTADAYVETLVPQRAGTGFITAVDRNGNDDATSSLQFTVQVGQAAPTITWLQRNASIGGLVKVRGQNLSSTETVKLGTASVLVLSRSAMSITFKVPPSIKPGLYRVFLTMQDDSRIQSATSVTVTEETDSTATGVSA